MKLYRRTGYGGFARPSSGCPQDSARGEIGDQLGVLWTVPSWYRGKSSVPISGGSGLASVPRSRRCSVRSLEHGKMLRSVGSSLVV